MNRSRGTRQTAVGQPLGHLAQDEHWLQDVTDS